MRIDSSPAWAEPRRVGLFSVLAAGVLLLAGSERSLGNPGNAAVAHLGTTTTTKVSNSQSDGTQRIPAQEPAAVLDRVACRPAGWP